MSMTRLALILSLVGAAACGEPTDKTTDDTDTDTVDTDTDTDTVVDTDTCEGTIDDCGVCDGGNADKDCDGVCFGEALEDACGTCDDDATNDCLATLNVAGGWACGAGESCQDLYELDLTAGTVLDIGVTSVTGASVTRIGLFAPGAGPSGLNLLTHTRNDWNCHSQDDDDEIVPSFTVPADGTYTLAIGRDWGASSGSGGTYILDVDASPGLLGGAQTDDDVTAETLGDQCGYSWTIESGWACLGDDSCRDVFDVDLVAGTSLNLSMTFVSGGSVPMLALYPPGTALSGINVLTGTATDLACGGQNSDLSSSYAIDTTGTWRIAVGRDWPGSLGNDGSYTFEVIEKGSFGLPAQTVDDVDSESGGPLCPF